MSVKLIIICGIPGSGKSELAKKLSRQIEIPCFSRDRIEAAIVTSNLDFPTKRSHRPDLRGVGYDVLTSLISGQLNSGQSAIVDSVCPKSSLRQKWRLLAEECGAIWCPIECICSDSRLHKTRLKNRNRKIPGWYEIEWVDIQRITEDFEPWDEDRLILDAKKPLCQNVDSAIAYIKDISAVSPDSS